MEETKTKNIQIRPVIALRNLCPIPDVKIRFEVGRDLSKKAISVSEKSFNKEIVLLLQKNDRVDNPTEQDIRPVGVLGTIDFKIQKPNGDYTVRIYGLRRVKLVKLLTDEQYLACQFEDAPEIITDENEAEVAIKLIKSELSKSNSKNFFDSPIPLSEIQNSNNKYEISNIVMYNFKNISEDEKYRFLESDDLNERLKLILINLRKTSLFEDIEQKINASVQDAIQQNQKEYYLREKIRAIQDELGDRTSREEDIQNFKQKMKDKGMPEDVVKRLNEEINRYLATSSMSAEANVIRNYLEFATDLPWSYQTKDCSDIKKVEKVLNENHYGLKKVKERILEYLSVQIKTKKNPQTIICFVGPPGVGKTSLAFSIAQALDRKFVKQSLGGIRDEAEIRGHRKTYVGAMPGRILKGMKLAQSVNPVFLLDEIDKMGVSYMGDPASAMLEVLDPEQNYRFSDNYLEESYDLSKVMFITTANYLEDIPEPLKDRMEIIFLSSYTEFEKLHIAKEHLIPKVLRLHGLTEKELTFTDDAIYQIIRFYTRESGVRELERLIASVVRKAIKKQLEKKITKIAVDPKEITKFLGKELYFHNTIKKKNEVGVVTGLAYTQYGGDTLEVEANYFPGKGNLNITGKLGDVMKESVSTAFSYIRSIAPKVKIDPKVFTENDFHVHVPEGAVPKDGPSAGITIATAIYSLVTNKKVRREVGMTGEITLRGSILPIGGLKEKAIAAHRTGLKKILIPNENQKDLEDIPEEVKKDLEIVPVKTLDEVFKQALV